MKMLNLLDHFWIWLIQTTLCSQIITSVNVPNAKYEEVEFKFEKSILAGEMNGKTWLKELLTESVYDLEW
jgi:hypothetical protein